MFMALRENELLRRPIDNGADLACPLLSLRVPIASGVRENDELRVVIYRAALKYD